MVPKKDFLATTHHIPLDSQPASRDNHKRMKAHWIFALFLNFYLWTLGCASDPPPPRGSARAHPAAYSQDHFTYNKDQKPRAENDFDFYYKHCSVDERKPFPVGAIWQCTFP